MTPPALNNIAAGPAVLIAFAVAMPLLTAPSGCRPKTTPPPANGQALLVGVSIPPQAWFVRRIGGPRVQVVTLLAAGQNPHTFEPTPRQVAQLSTCRLYFRTGWPFEQSVLPRLTAAARQLRVVDTLQGLPLRKAEDHDEHDHDEHDAEHADDHDAAAAEYVSGMRVHEGLSGGWHPQAERRGGACAEVSQTSTAARPASSRSLWVSRIHPQATRAENSIRPVPLVGATRP